MDAVLLGALAGALFGLLAIAVRHGLGRGADPEVGAVVVLGAGSLVACALALPQAAALGDPGELWPFLLIGALVPGTSQILFILAVRDAGPARASILIGTAPLISVGLALLLLDEPFRPLLLVATVLVVAGGVVLAGERSRPAAFRALGAVLAIVCAVLFAVRDNAVRWAAQDLDPPAVAAAAVSLLGALAIVAAYLLVARRRRLRTNLGSATVAFWPAGVALGLAYVSLIVAFDRGRVGIVAPLNATQSLWAVALSAVLVGRSEAVGRHTVLAGALVVAGAVLVGIVR
ncbi:MAG TPA: DMT family transporter [Gaiella sp.]|uniref:DMT family transporter n=1 Tax=Gaiella sp. TaxID=2663207 RepID=UPI002D806B4D|nr:DMT family transporter [Gaiella sp.]HET9286162.1 DMT family transporter [Gaiella sp.]